MSAEPNWKAALERFRTEAPISGPGPLCLVIVMTRLAIKSETALNPDELITEQQGQVKGLGKSAVQAVLKEHGITRVLASEGGRTSRGNMRLMRQYVPLLNDLTEQGADLHKIEAWWVECVKEYFASKPFKLSIDRSKSLSSALMGLIAQAEKKQKENRGTMYVGALLQHLVGAKLDLALPNVTIAHNGFSTADAPTMRSGDFLLGDSVIHVTTTPTESLMGKCRENIAQGLRPIIVTRQKGVTSAESLAEGLGLADRIDIYDVNQFLSLNLYELFSFNSRTQGETIQRFVDKYNEIVDTYETDPSLRIEI